MAKDPVTHTERDPQRTDSRHFSQRWQGLLRLAVAAVWGYVCQMSRLLRRIGLGFLLVTFATSSVAADFNPRGRGRKPKTATPTPRAPKAPRSATGQPRSSQTKSATPGTPAPNTSAADEPNDALIKRYTGIVLNQPGAEFPLQRLAELYRNRDGNLDQLIGEFEKRAAQIGPGQYNATIALAGIYRQANKIELAIKTYNEAVASKPKDPEGLMAIARLYQAQGQPSDARAYFERALPLLKNDADVEQVLRLLMKLALETNDLPGARKFHQTLVKRAKGSFFVQTELGAELLQRGDYPQAEEEFQRVVQAARGDNRALAPALRDLGKAQGKQGKHEEALKTLQRALKLTSTQSGLHRELLDVMVEVYRDAERLNELVALLEKAGSRDFDRLRLLGGLYEELGRIDDAQKTYEQALASRPKDLEVRLRLVQLLQLQGQLDRAIVEYRSLIRAAPHNPDFVFRLAEALLQRGEREQAVAELKKLEQRSQGDEQVQAALVDFYERVGESERGLALLERLSQGQRTDPHHLVELGDRYFREGDTEKAKRTWKRILLVVPSRSRALSILGEVYLDHDMAEEALDTLREATKLAPDDQRLKKALALALERAGAGAPKRVRLRRYEESLRLWEHLLVAGKTDPRLAREARRHIITLWSLGGSLERRLAPLERNLKAKPPDLASGRLLAQSYLRLKRLPDAERVLYRVTHHAPGDVQSHLMLEQALVQQRKLAQAVEVLSKLVKMDPTRARDYYQRMGSYSAQMYKDDDAIRFAAKAVELSPEDAQGHKNLAEMYARRQNIDRAISEYRKAIEKNDRLFPAYFDLAELLISQQKVDEADRLLRRVVRSAVDEELLARATRLSTQLNLSRGTLESLEKELLPVALANSQKPIYRRLLVELYGSLTFPLVQKAKSSDPTERAAAKGELKRIGQRAVKPLLDALSDQRDSQQHVAIELLTHLRNENANQALFTYATGEGDPKLRVRAMIAVGATGDAKMLPSLKTLLFEDNDARVDEGDPIALAAVWALCQIQTKDSSRLLRRLLLTDSPTAQALSAIALSLRGEPVDEDLKRLLDSSEHGNVPRAAAAFALGQLGATSAREELYPLTRAGDPRVRAAALVAATRLGEKRAPEAIARALVSDDDGLRNAAVGAAGVLGTGRYDSAGDPLAVPEGRVDAAVLLHSLRPKAPAPDARARAIAVLAGPLTEMIPLSIQRSPEHAALISDALLSGQGKPAFGELSQGLENADPALQKRAVEALTAIAASAVVPFINLSRHPSAEVRTTALLFVATRSEPAAQATLLEALRDSDARVRRLVLGKLGQRPKLDALPSVVSALEQADNWNERSYAIEIIGKFGALGAPSTAPDMARAIDALSKLARTDEFAFVRQKAAESLAALAGRAARDVLQTLATDDPEARVRKTASELLSRLK